ncbi:MAG: glycosyltransferase family 9 protein [Terriglobia bacterium]
MQSRIVDHAIEQFDAAEQLGYDPGECAAARWNCWMMLGDFGRAWEESDRISRLDRDPNRFWTGESWKGKRVILRCLHGLGDTIQFIRYAPLLKSTCRSLIVQSHPQLVTLMECVPGVDGAITWGEEQRSEWDLQMEVTELPRAFRTTIATIPRTVPYINVPQERFEWASGFFASRDSLRVGICWQSGDWDPSRSIPLEEFAPLFTHDHCDFYALQKNADPAAITPYPALEELESHASDVRDTAALIQNLDLVISVDTMTAHLAGALGKPVFVLLPGAADWRWMLERRDTPWYPTARLFRQKEPARWENVARAVLDAVASCSVHPGF